MKIVEEAELTIGQKERIVEIWNAEYPASIAHPDLSSFEDYLNNLGEKRHFLLFDENEILVGWTMLFVRDGAKWFAILVDAKFQGKGCGVKLIDALKSAEKRFFGWVIDNDDNVKSNGTAYKSPLEFYKKIGFAVHTDEKLIKEEISGVKIEWNG
ncbi:MAG: GNAT family N-acetyltransferase [Pyrinomonadaceae bacterium]|nr:GNAT family N-acetyltransferase [Pyrinomonadaceae bacterium]